MTKKLIIATIAVLFCFNATAQTGSTPFLLKNNNVVLDNTVPRAGMPGIVKFRLDSGIYEDNTNGSWVIFAKMAYTYNDAENLTEYIFYYRNQETNIWEEENSTQYIYDDNERVVEEIENVWNNGEWWPQVKIEYYYDANDNVIEEIEYEWDGADEAWYEIFKMEYVYESGTLMEELEYEWDDVEQSWFTVWKTEYIYTTNSVVGEELGYEYDGSDWILAEKTEYGYDENNYLAMETFYYREGDQWIPEEKTEHTFEANGDYVFWQTYLWDETISDYVPEHKMELNYNTDYAFEDLIVPNFDQHAYNHMLTDHMMSFWNEDNGIWVQISRGTIFYSEQTISGIETTGNEAVTVYPNPAGETVQVTLRTAPDATFELYNIGGQLMLSENLSTSDKTISLEGIAQGVYFYKVITGNRTYSGKIIKQ